MRSLSIALGLVLAAAGCGRDTHQAIVRGGGSPVAASWLSNVLLVPVSVGTGAPRPVIVDTGSPETVLAPARWGGEVGAGPFVVERLTIGATTVEQVPALGIDLFGDLPASSFAPTGVLGGDLLCRFSVVLDYRARTVRLGVPPVASDAAVGFRLEGGGSGSSAGQAYRYPATRISVLALVDDTPRVLVVDSGASYVVLRDAAWQAMVADGRPRLDPVPIAGAGGTLAGRLARAHTVSLAGESVADAPVLDVGDDLLDGLAAEVGHPVEGLLGGTFLRQFLVTLDYPGAGLHLRRYPDASHLDPDEFHQVGITLDGNHAITHVYDGTDAARAGLREGDRLLAVDGKALAADLHAAEQQLHGPVGALRHLSTDRAELDVLVDDLLPIR